MFEFICGGAVTIPSRMTVGSDPGFSGSPGATGFGLALPHAGSPWGGAQDRQVILPLMPAGAQGRRVNRGAVGLWSWAKCVSGIAGPSVRAGRGPILLSRSSVVR